MQNKEDYTIDELLNAALQCEQCEEYDMALKYYRAVLAKDQTQSAAKLGVERNKNQLAKTVYFRTPANFKLTTGRLELRRGMIVFVADGGAEVEYDLEEIESPRIKLGRLVYDYKGTPIEGYSCSVAKKWIGVIGDVKNGKYPDADTGKLNKVQKYIKEHYNRESIEEAIEYFEEMTGCDYSDSRIVVMRLL